jgi:hypothetical protein
MAQRLPELELHARLCRQARGRWFAARAAAEELRAWFAPRVLSSTLLMLALLGGLSWLLR